MTANAVANPDYQSVRVLGLDQDTKVAAWTVVEGGTYKGSNEYWPGGDDVPALDLEDRLSRIYDFVENIVMMQKAHVLVIEVPTGDHGNPHTDRVLGYATGVCLAAGFQVRRRRERSKRAVIKELDIIMVTPPEAQATGYSKHDQRDAELLAGRRLSEHEADSIGVACAGWLKWKEARMLAGVAEVGE